ncbi:hypothetical protein DXF93_28875 [Escherichia coli]|nr:hypothetical protein DXF93_28875 [Escherichia coli]
MSTSRTFQMKMVRPDEEEMVYLWKLFYAAQRVEDRWGHGLAEISEELSYCPDMTREQKLFLLRAWQVLAADKGGFGRFMGAYDTYVHNMQDPKDDCVAWKPSLIELFGNAELLPIVLEAYQEAQQYIAELEAATSCKFMPDGYVLMPMKLTAENGAKYALSGEFHVLNRVTCHECGGEGCSDCDDEGLFEEKIMIGWDDIKEIYAAAVKACSIQKANEVTPDAQ